MKEPEVNYPTVVRGYVLGTELRCESLDGSEVWLTPEQLPLHDGKGFLLRNFGPFVMEEKQWCVSHLQKKSPYFWFQMDPFILHWGKFWKLQEYSKNPDGGWSFKAGTESGIYTRTPGWRWQQPDAVSGGRPWIFTKGYFGFHLD